MGYDLDAQIYGWRRFRVFYPNLYVEPHSLIGAWSMRTWPTDRPMVAKCEPYGGNGTPCSGGPLKQTNRCKCGLHLYYDYEGACGRKQTDGPAGYVITVAAGAGRILFDRAYARCEYAKVLAIVDPIEYRPQTRRLGNTAKGFRTKDATAEIRNWAAKTADRYGIPILSYIEAEVYAISQGYVSVAGVEDALDGREIVRGVDDS